MIGWAYILCPPVTQKGLAMKARTRKAGILLPITSLPSPYGIGTLGRAAFEFIDFLKEAGQSYWQILPTGPTGYGDSPYQSFSTFAGNPYFIDLEDLVQEELLEQKDCDEADLGSDPQYVDYEKQYKVRMPLLKKAYHSFIGRNGESERDYKTFVKENAYWLEDYALFMAIKDDHDGKSYSEWDEDIRLRKKEALAAYKEKCSENYGFYCFLQYYFAKEWALLKTYANQNGIKIIGDIPIYVATDSADTWANPQLFQFDKMGRPTGVAGCPPDVFSKTGQLWGNPLYDWDYHKKTQYTWWTKRIKKCFELYDVVRIDHFRGFESYYAIPYGDPTAEFGTWKKGPGMDLFDTLKKNLGKMEVIAEDLGFLTPEVYKMVRKSGFPGMKVLQFAFDPEGDSEYLPHHYPKNSVVYTGTHDNDTSIGAFKTLSKAEKAFAKEYFGVTGSKNINWVFVRQALASQSDTAIILMQDYLGLGSEARINIPSTLGNNWKWRMLPGMMTRQLAGQIRNACFVYARCEKE